MGKTIFFSILILLAGFGLAYLGSKYISIIEFEISVVLAFMGISYAFFQFQIEKIQAEKRRINDIKLLTYKELIKEFGELVADYNWIYIRNFQAYINDLIKESDKYGNNVDLELISLSINMPNRLTSFFSKVNCYEKILDCKLNNSDCKKIQDLVMELISKKIFDDKEKYSGKTIDNEELKKMILDKISNDIIELYKLQSSYNEFLVKSLLGITSKD